jgi:phage host-nuclease inhibitor protein Gam
MSDPVELLNRLAEYQAQRTVAELDKQALVDSVLTPEIKAKLAEIDAEFADKVAAVDQNIAELTAQIKEAVIQNGSSVKGTHLQAVYTKGRVSWNTKLLEGLAMVIPQVNEAKIIGEPSVSIRKIG